MKYLDFSKTKNSEIATGYIFHGGDIYFLSEGVKKVINLVAPENPELNIDRVDDEKSFFFSLEAMPFLAEHRLVIFQRADFTADFSKKLKEYLKNPNPTTVFVLTTEKILKGSFDAEMIDCRKEATEMLAKWIVAKCRMSQKIISLPLAKDVAGRCLGDMARISKEVEKLVMYSAGNEITAEDVEVCTPKESERMIFDLTNAIGDKNAKLTREIMLEIESSLTIFQVQGLLYKMFQRMFFIRTSEKSDGELAKVLGVKETAIMMTRRRAEKFSKLKLKESVEYLEGIDAKIKSGSISQDGAMEDAILFLMK